MKIKTLCTASVFCALLCVAAPLSIPVGPIALSLASYIIAITALVFDFRISISVLSIYVLLGCVGLPVFQAFGGGISHLAGPSGGFVLGYFPFLTVCSIFGRNCNAFKTSLVIGLATLILYMCGLIHFMLVTESNIFTALVVTVVPFIPGDVLKALLVFPCKGKIQRIIYKN